MIVYVSGLLEKFDNQTNSVIRIHDLKVYKEGSVEDAIKQFLFENHLSGNSVIHIMCGFDGEVLEPSLYNRS